MVSGDRTRGGAPGKHNLNSPTGHADKAINTPNRGVAMDEPVNLTEIISELEVKIRKLEIAALVMFNLIILVYLLTR
jgi:hypothetical protein